MTQHKQYIKKTKLTPEIKTNLETGVAFITGESAPENAHECYKPIFEFTHASIQKNNKIHLNFNLDYFNTTTSKVLIELFKLLESFHTEAKDCLVLWHIPNNDFDLIEAAEDLLYGILIPFKIIK